MRIALWAALLLIGGACSSSSGGNNAGGGGSSAGGSGAAGGAPAGGTTSDKAGYTSAGTPSAGLGGGSNGGGGNQAAGTTPVGGNAEAGAAGSPEQPVCDAEHAEACPRGMYLSLWADHNGQNVFAGDTAQHLNILGDSAKEKPVLDFIDAHAITSLSLYDLYPILGDAGRKAALEAFLEKARAHGVSEVIAICDTTEAAWDQIAAEQTSAQLFDGVVTEIEFWADNSFDTFKTAVAYVRGLGMKARGGQNMPINVYVGYPTAEQVAEMAPLVDRLFVHVYVTSPDKAFGYGKKRFLDIAAANQAKGTHLEVRPIFSAEGTAWAAGAEHFMGDWLGANSMAEAEKQVLTAWKAEPAESLPPFGGFQWFEYFYLERYVK